jgi:hypothetical protein
MNVSELPDDARRTTLPPLPDDFDSGDPNDELVFDEFGSLIARTRIRIPTVDLRVPCSLAALNGSWLIELTSTFPRLGGSFAFFSRIRGPMRIEASSGVLRVSGDIYVSTPVLQPVRTLPLVSGLSAINANSYPAFPQGEYRWYFRSLGCTYAGGKLTFNFERHLWNTTLQEFTASDTGSLSLTCLTEPVLQPAAFAGATLGMTGTASIGRWRYNVSAVKTSPFFRGCLVEVDVMSKRSFPGSAANCSASQTHTFTGVYREAGLDFEVRVDELAVPEDTSLTEAELHNLLLTHRSLSAGGENWRVWLLVGSALAGAPGVLGLMFDTGQPPHREGAVAFFDPTLPNLSTVQASARGKKAGTVPLAFMRTLLHEAGHAFNLFHPKADVHAVPIGTTIMNQTGDVMSFATSANPFPCNSTMAFDTHNRSSLIHSPDPQVKPGWKEFGWGHDVIFTGLAEPIDALGLGGNDPDAVGLRLTLDIPSEVERGAVVFATVTVANEDSVPRRVSAALNLAERDLTLKVILPNQTPLDVADVVLICAERRLVELQPGESRSGTFQLFYTNKGFTFDQPGKYSLQAELETGEPDGSVVRSNVVEVYVRAPASDALRDMAALVMDPAVGLAFALGDFGADTDAQDRLTTVMNRHGDTETGAAAALILANSLARDFHDLRTGQTLREADRAASAQALDVAVKGRAATSLAQYATAIVAPRETGAPLIGAVQKRLAKPGRGRRNKGDLEQAKAVIANFLGETNS